jgi:SnoaL-like domain
MTDQAPDVISRYLMAADDHDFRALAECFTTDGTARDEGKTYVGREEIIAWRKSVASTYVYTSSVLGSESDGDDGYVVTVHVEGNFPGGQVDLQQKFTLRDDLISALVIE